jgi:hypothetical protein
MQIDVDPDLDPVYHFYADPNPSFHFDADPDPQHWSHAYLVTVLTVHLFPTCLFTPFLKTCNVYFFINFIIHI